MKIYLTKTYHAVYGFDAQAFSTYEAAVAWLREWFGDHLLEDVMVVEEDAAKEAWSGTYDEDGEANPWGYVTTRELDVVHDEARGLEEDR